MPCSLTLPGVGCRLHSVPCGNRLRRRSPSRLRGASLSAMTIRARRVRPGSWGESDWSWAGSIATSPSGASSGSSGPNRRLKRGLVRSFLDECFVAEIISPRPAARFSWRLNCLVDAAWRPRGNLVQTRPHMAQMAARRGRLAARARAAENAIRSNLIGWMCQCAAHHMSPMLLNE